MKSELKRLVQIRQKYIKQKVLHVCIKRLNPTERTQEDTKSEAVERVQSNLAKS